MLQRVGPYEVVRELARGGMGVVYLARDPALEREVALKVVAPVALDAEGLERFRREGRAAARLRHPNIVGVHAVGALPGGPPYLVMDLVEGESLRERVRRDGPLPPALAARLVAQVAHALDYAHGRGVLHRDLKPANILIDRTGAPALTDFGVARLLDRASRVTATGEVLGTPAYMAPEQADGDQARVGTAADIYGLGATLYELLTGLPPFAGIGGVAVLQAVLTRPPEPPRSLRPELDPALEAIVLRCLEKEPDRRHPSAEALAQALEDWLDAGARAPGRRRRPGARRAAIAAVVVVPLLVAGERVWASRRASDAVARAREAAALASTSADLEEAAVADVARAERARTAGLVAAMGHAPAAAALLREAADLARDDAARAELLGRRALLLLERGDREGARADADEALRLAPAEPLAALVQLLLGSFDVEARAAVEALGERAGDHVPILELRAQVRFDAADLDGALDDAERALALDRGAVRALRLRAAVRLARGEAAAARDDAGAAVALAPDDVEAWRLLAAAARATGDTSRALHALDRALERQEVAALLMQRAELRAGLGDVQGARTDAARAVRRDLALAPTAQALERRLGDDARLAADPRQAIELASRADPAEARRALDAAIAAGEGVGAIELRAWRAVVRVDLGELAAAAEDVQAVQERAPVHPVNDLAQALIVWRRGDVQGALARVRRVVEAAPDLAYARAVEGALLQEAGDLAGARAAVDRALALDPRQVRALSLRAELRLGAGELGPAIEDAARAVALGPRLPLGWIVLAEARLLQGDDAAAIEAASRALLDGDHPRALYVRARALFTRDPAAALADLDRIPVEQPGDVGPTLVRMAALVHLGRRDEARAVGEAALAATSSRSAREVLREALERLGSD